MVIDNASSIQIFKLRGNSPAEEYFIKLFCVSHLKGKFLRAQVENLKVLHPGLESFF